MTVSFIYSFCNNEDKGTEKEWKWIIGKELTMQRDLSDFVNDSKTLFHYLSRSRAKSYMVFANNKKELSDKNDERRHEGRLSFHLRLGDALLLAG